MPNNDTSRILAHIAASYARRELDRKFYDSVLASPVGRRLNELSDGQKYALEFAAYALSAVVLGLRREPNIAIQFLSDVVADAPTEIARRMINGTPEFTGEDLRTVVGELTVDDIEPLIQPQSSGGSTPPNSKDESPSFFAELADRIEKSAERLRERRKRL